MPDTKARKAPGKMKSWIGQWSGSLETGDLRFNVAAESTPEGLRAKVATLGVGDYDTLTGRTGSASVKEVKRNSIAIG